MAEPIRAVARPATPDPLSARDMRAGLANGSLTSRAIVERSLARIEALDPALNAFTLVASARALEIADARDLERRAGLATGPLHGLPLGVKDLIDVAGLPTLAGSRVRAGHVAEASSNAVARLEAAGMIVLGKTNTVEFGFGGWGTNAVTGTPRNPWDAKTHRVPGGSSSGSAVAVAAGLTPFAIGSDTGGSVRIPAGLCGTVGLKTSLGLVGRSGVVPLCPTHDTVGPLTSTVADAALMLDAMAGFDAGDGTTRGAPAPDAARDLARGVAGLSIACLDADEMSAVDRDVATRMNEAVNALRNLGARVTPLSLPATLATYMEMGGALMSAESYASLAEHVDRADSLIAPSVRARMLRGRDVPASVYLAALERRREAQAAFLEVFDGFDAFLAPTCPFPAIPVAEVDEDKTPLSAFGRFVNYLELAAVTLPYGLSGGATPLPCGVQIAVRRFEDRTALRIAAALEAAQGGAHLGRPPLG